ncbi:ribonuclease HII [Candidatus Daviesbacteria bacterium]|nr:ribonuclease HII [Candidatus Daviesbacteria bacterium]
MILPTLDYEQNLWRNNFKYVCGIDEVGRGCFAGPVVVGTVIFSPDCILPEGIADSKLLKPSRRKLLAKKIKECAISWAIAEIPVSKINKFGIGKATQMAFRKVIKNLKVRPDFVLIDAFYIKHLSRKYQKALKNGDKICTSIAAASIIAKVYRDELMKKLHRKFPNYGFSKHKGYGTKFHQEAIKKFGLSKIHRTSFNLEKFLVSS